MGKLCISCLETYKQDSIGTKFKRDEEGIYQVCPRQICGGKVYEIDDLILPTIILLNKKGYLTDSSCSGHYDEFMPMPYIRFNSVVKELPLLPDGFTLSLYTKTSGDECLILIRDLDYIDPFDVFGDLVETARELHEWAIELEQVDYEEVYGIRIFSVEQWLGEEEESKEEPSAKFDVEKIKKDFSSASIKLKAKEEPPAAPTEEVKEEPKKKKRGRPRKNKE